MLSPIRLLFLPVRIQQMEESLAEFEKSENILFKTWMIYEHQLCSRGTQVPIIFTSLALDTTRN